VAVEGKDLEEAVVVDDAPVKVWLGSANLTPGLESTVWMRPITALSMLVVQERGREGLVEATTAYDLADLRSLTLTMAPPHATQRLIFVSAPGRVVLFSSTPFDIKGSRLVFAGDPECRLHRVDGRFRSTRRTIQHVCPLNQEKTIKAVLLMTRLRAGHRSHNRGAKR
jgi:hypothetical protein